MLCLEVLGTTRNESESLPCTFSLQIRVEGQVMGGKGIYRSTFNPIKSAIC